MRLTQLRQFMKSQTLDGLIVPHADEYQNEYLPASRERLAWISGFQGSAGCAIITEKHAVLFVDGRYTLAAKNQVDVNQWSICHLIEQPPHQWLQQNGFASRRIGYDPWLHTPRELDQLKKSALMVALDANPVDQIWRDRPKQFQGKIEIFPAKFAGIGSAAKRAQIAKLMVGKQCHAAVIASCDSIAWLLNIRGSDIPYNPLVCSFAVIKADESVDWYVDAKNVTPEIRKHLGNGVGVFAPDDFARDLALKNSQTIMLDPANCPAKVEYILSQAGARIVHGDDVCVFPKAQKNKAEQNGMRNAHRRDGVAMTRFLHWLSEQNVTRHDEISISQKLESFRAMDKSYRGPSFATIAGFGPHGAIVHYRADAKTKSKLSRNNILLLDSGGQYVDGTTDITRTVALGKISAEQRDRYTRVLKGHIALATAQFPAGTSGSQLDALARQFLWQAGLDYDHGTGHGVGCYLCVHEGPQRISRVPNRVALLPGMVISNEPGYYKPGAYGIRIENLVMVREVKGRKGFLEFETLTLAPIDTKLVDKKMLNAAELSWLNAYHARVYRELNKKLDSKTAVWLKRVTKKL